MWSHVKNTTLSVFIAHLSFIVDFIPFLNVSVRFYMVMSSDISHHHKDYFHACSSVRSLQFSFIEALWTNSELGRHAPVWPPLISASVAEP